MTHFINSKVGNARHEINKLDLTGLVIYLTALAFLITMITEG